MEAIAEFDFDAEDEDELCFRKGQVLKVLNMEDSMEWYIAEKEGKEGLIPSNHVQMKEHDWYYGHTTRREAEKILLDEDDGAFLVRISVNTPRDFSLSVKFPASVEHFKVMRNCQGKYSLRAVKFDSLNELVEYHKSHSVSRSQDVKLKDMAPDEEVTLSIKVPTLIKKLTVQAIYDFEPQEEGELEFHSGDIITVLDNSDPDWWEGEVENRTGCFPANYVKPCTYYNSSSS